MPGRLGGKHNYPKGRKLPVAHKKKRPKGIIYANSKNKRKMSEWMLILLSYAPPDSTLYTTSYAGSESNRYQYMDVFSIYDNQLYKITGIVANILHYVTLDRHYRFNAEDTLAVRTGREHTRTTREQIFELEKEVVRRLSFKVLKRDDGFKHISILRMSEYTQTTNENYVESDEPIKKTYILRKPIDKVL